MADLKISQLSSATALAGTEVVPVVQGGTTKKATIDQILAPASGKGINFAAAGGDTLTMYDEGTWTPTLTPGTSGTITSYTASGTYTRIGRQVTVQFKISITNAGTGVGAAVISLPFTQGNHTEGGIGCGREDGATGLTLEVYGYPNQNYAYVALYNNNPTVVTGYVLLGTYTFFV